MEPGTLSAAELPFGARVRAAFTKYDGRPHWEYDLVVLGVDEHGVWVGGAPGGRIARPGLEFVSDAHWVSLYPHDGMWVATVNDHGGTFSSRIYVDVTSQASWWHRPDGVLAVSAVDLDLDVILRFTGEVFIDDEDEFEEHRLEMDYPADVVDGARSAATWLYDRLRSGAEPFADIAESWVALCRERVGSDASGRAVIDPDPQAAAPLDARAGTGTDSRTSADAETDAEDEAAAHAAADVDTRRSAARSDADTDALPVQDLPVDAPWQSATSGRAGSRGEDQEEQDEDLLAVWADEARDRPLVADLDPDDEPAVEVESDDEPYTSPEVDWSRAGQEYGEADYPYSGTDVARDFADVEGIDTSPVDPVEVTGILVTTETGVQSPLWFDGRPVDPEEVDITGELADHLRDWADRWTRDFDPVRGWHPRAVIGDYEALGRWLGRRVKDEVGGVAVTLQLAHLGRSSLTEIPAAETREPEVVTLDPGAPGELPVRGDIVTLAGTVGCFSSEVNMRLSSWAAAGGGDEGEAEELRWFMSSELGPDYRVL